MIGAPALDASPLHPVNAVLTTRERNDLEVLISAGVTYFGWDSPQAGPGLGADEPIRQACRRLGLDVAAFR